MNQQPAIQFEFLDEFTNETLVLEGFLDPAYDIKSVNNVNMTAGTSTLYFN